MKDLTSYVYGFEELIQGKFLYVDKTEYIWQLIRPSSAGYFFSRPRRFGKSLTLSTLKAVFQGKKELFTYSTNGVFYAIISGIIDDEYLTDFETDGIVVWNKF